MGQLHVGQLALNLPILLTDLKSLGRAHAPEQDRRLDLSR
jgi:hypothetical protein